MTIYELTDSYQELIDRYLTEEDEYERIKLEQQLWQLGDDIREKAENYARFIRNVDGEIKALKAEEKRLSEERKRREQLVENLKLGIQSVMIATGERKIETSVGKWSLQKNPFSCVITDFEAVPERFKTERIEIDIDKKAMIDEYKRTGEEFDGVTIEQREGVRFR